MVNVQKNKWSAYIKSMERWVLIMGIISLSYTILFTITTSIICIRCEMAHWIANCLYFFYDICIALLTGFIVYFITTHIRFVRDRNKSDEVVASYVRKIYHSYRIQILPQVEIIKKEMEESLKTNPPAEGEVQIHLHFNTKTIERWASDFAMIAINYIGLNSKYILDYLDISDDSRIVFRDITTGDVFNRDDNSQNLTYNEILSVDYAITLMRKFYNDDGTRKESRIPVKFL